MKNRETTFDYFEHFVRYSEKCYESGRFVKTCFNTFRKDSFPKQLTNMHQMEQEADEFYHSIVKRLAKEFLPPIDREDIMAIVQKYDDIIDAMDDLMQKIYMYHITFMRPGITAFSDLLLQILDGVKKMSQEFRYYKKSKKLKNYIISVNEMESKGDNLYALHMHKLFVEESRELQIIKWKAIYDAYELCYDECEELSNLMELVVLKNK